MTAQVNSGNTYVITNVKGGTAMDLSAADNTSVIGWPVHGGVNQQWSMNWTGKAWTFRSAATGLYLGIGGTPADGTRIVVSATPFEWHIWRADNDQNTFRIFVPFTHQNLDLYGDGLRTPGDPITLWYTWNGLHQTWRFTKV
ncbi:carbohydrate-binding module family 13 protein [Hebeloma cylindrosporum]|uniref:Carbohydrate-binding module family 13 protein n=1 Tax=Hebeloma cylindrosporum TaxID=76867 RepID=A0A0C3CJK0_HEBCY|nr:carbohydrate-binding module family 13 protein [Hebeloma cylindrosporum h7]